MRSRLGVPQIPASLRLVLVFDTVTLKSGQTTALRAVWLTAEPNNGRRFYRLRTDTWGTGMHSHIGPHHAGYRVGPLQNDSDEG